MTAVFGLFGSGLLCLAAVAAALRGLPERARAAAWLTAGILIFVPFAALSAAGYVRGVIGDVSITTLVLAGAACARGPTGRNPIGHRNMLALMGLVAAGAAFLYPFALGLTYFDPYALGYGSIGFIAALFALTLVAWYARFYLAAIVVTAAALAYLAGIYESRNLWDYLLDPLVSLFAAGWLLRAARRSPSGGNRSTGGTAD
ncbi:MAG: hypothetical protein A2151_03955 [Candidatus Muproteobacteria bacterium RBG_16_65_34]|uniref:Uncharacterized protein n=1 Tax=Candidatus Muproteobacteria bacterium RBG_16_65_34 TaxID=1817760 RepID=A0A1F6TN43_9PROT|nr:MAG: hypothetical protein A2151_03955 [Candidatus Muproteobacteria bacterium RBG_16_65_34]